MPKDKTTSFSKNVGDKSEKLVLDYLTKQNRPYSVTDVISNLHASISKTECQRVVNALVEKELLTTKLYGKQAIYVVRQDTIDAATPEELAGVDGAIAKLQNQITESKSRNRQLSSELSALNSALTTDQIRVKLDRLATKNEQSKLHLSQLGAGTELVTLEEKQSVAKEMEFYRKMWLERRRLFKDMFAAVTENIPGKPKDLLEDLDIDVQEPIDVNINPRHLVQA
ncbi:Tat binding protein 1-interacting protein-domain-containing protein [Dissophora ornata]|nr:PSMC3 interacting protein [Dissophora ornata]KAI8597787.1 Tat binding protein 1-interacting protein-domain-containing protein [Dissophora ornata]